VGGERGDGIRVLTPDTFLSGNITNNFAGYGINAVEGVKSGVNYATGNGNPAQCLNVSCVPGGSAPSDPPADPGPAEQPGPPPPAAPSGQPGKSAGPALDVPLPVITLVVKKTQMLAKTVALAVRARENRWVTVTGSASVRGTSRRYELKAVKDRFVAGGSERTFKLALPGRARQAIRQALRQGGQVKATLTVDARDAAGNRSAKKRTIRIKH
jgi:hypothetical protein